MKTVRIVVFGEQARLIEDTFGMKFAGTRTDVNTKVVFEKLPAKGHSKVEISFDI